MTNKTLNVNCEKQFNSAVLRTNNHKYQILKKIIDIT